MRLRRALGLPRACESSISTRCKKYEWALRVINQANCLSFNPLILECNEVLLHSYSPASLKPSTGNRGPFQNNPEKYFPNAVPSHTAAPKIHPHGKAQRIRQMTRSVFSATVMAVFTSTCHKKRVHQAIPFLRSVSFSVLHTRF